MPFWKKTDKGGKKKPPKSAVPRTAQQSIPMQRMFEDGTCRVKPNYYTRTIAYQDINYQLAQQEDKTAIFEEWCSFLNFFDSSIKFELSFVNMATDSTEFEKSIRIPYQKDGFDDVRAEYSQMLRQQLAKGNNGLTKTKFITFGVEGESMAQVKPRLDHIQNDLLNNFHRLGVQAKPLNGVQRLKLMHDMFNMDGASKFHFDWKDLVKSGLSVKDAIAPTAFAFKNSRTFQMGGIFCAASFLSITASDISDQLLKDFLDMDSSQIVTMHIQSVDQNRAIKTVKRTITELDRSKIEEQKKAIRAGYALVAAKQTNSAPVQKITIIPRTSGALGYTMQVEQTDKVLMTKEELENKIATLTGGRAAEELVFGQITTGASNDIEQATKLARAMVTRYGMTDEFDMVAMETVTNQYLGGDTSLACSADTQKEIDKKVVETVKAQHEKARRLLAEHRSKLDELAKYLYEKETITGSEFMKILQDKEGAAK